jgi:hypothetical protein
MKIVCQSCGKKYDTDRDELCPNCGSYNPFSRESTEQRVRSMEVSFHERSRRKEEVQESLEEDEDWQEDFQQRDNPELGSKQPKTKKKGCLGGFVKTVGLLLVLMGMIPALAEWGKPYLMRMVWEQTRADRIRTEEYALGETVDFDKEIQLTVTGIQELELHEETRENLGCSKTVKIAAVMLELKDEGRNFLSYGEQKAYLRLNGMVYEPLDYWAERILEEEYQILSVDSFAEEGQPQALFFMIPQTEQPQEGQLCVQTLGKVPIVDISTVTELTVMDLNREGAAV